LVTAGATAVAQGPTQSPLPSTSPAAAISPVPAAAWRVTARVPITVDDGRIISMSPDGSRFVAAEPAVGYQRGSLCTFQVATGAQIACADLSKLEAGLRIEDVTWSPDGRWLAFAEQTFVRIQDGDLWLMDASTGALTNIADDGYSGNFFHARESPAPHEATLPVNPAFTPDGLGVTYSRSRIVDGKAAGNDIVTVPLTGGEPRMLVGVTTTEIGVAYFGMRWAPDGSRLYYSVQHVQHDNPDNGIWVVNADGSDAHLLVGAPDADSWGPAVLQVAADGAHLLSWDPAYANNFSTHKPVFSVVDTSTGVSTPLLPLDPATPPYAWVDWAGFSPDGGSVLTLTRGAQPTLDVRVRDIGASVEYQLVVDENSQAGWISNGIPLTWAPNGIALITGGGHFGTATALTIEAGSTPDVSPSEGASPAP
jgi:Tol biopolymer transport system component